VFGFDAQLWHIWQTSWSNGWSGWAPSGGPWPDLTWPPAAGASGDGRIELFVAAGQLLHSWQTAWSNGWSGWISHGTPPGPGGFWAPGIAPNANGRLELFVADGALWRLEQTAWSNGWSGWQPHGTPAAPVVGPPAAVRTGDGRVQVFVVDTRGALWSIEQNAPAGAWSGWNSFGAPPGGLDDRPAVARSGDGRLELFVRGSDGALWHRWELGVGPGAGWSGWTSHGSGGGGFIDHPDMHRSADGRLEIFITGRDGAVWHQWQTAASNGWSGWFSHGAPGGGLGAAAPAVSASGDGRLELFGVGADGNLWHKWQTAASNGWSNWASHGQP